MVFSSLPPYLDPSNWHPPPPQPHGGSGSIRPGSMSERARQANIPMPESALKCPRCDSTNTKFCYFNNYSLTQPRHFCKTCRRYWTRGGALRTVPVGGGCRRTTKRSSKSSSSKSSPATSSDKPNPPAPYSGGLFQPLRFTGDIIQPTTDALLHHQSMAGFHGGAASNFLGFEQWKNMQQFPFLGGLDPPPGPQMFSGGGGGELGFLGGGVDQFRPKMSSSFLSQLASVKMEETKNTSHAADLSCLVSRELMLGNDDQWINMNGGGGGNWTELSGFTSSTSNHLQ